MIDPYWLPLVYALLLLLAGLALLILEFFIVSFGLLATAALGCAVGAVYFAFQLSPVIGSGFIALAGFTGALTLRWGIQRISESGMVPKTAITADAGYRHTAAKIGVSIGSVGILVTPARPSGRAKFAGGECDVQASANRTLPPGTKIVVERIDGPIIFVTTADS